MTKAEKKQIIEWRNNFANELKRFLEEREQLPEQEEFMRRVIAERTDDIVLNQIRAGISPKRGVHEALFIE